VAVASTAKTPGIHPR